MAIIRRKPRNASLRFQSHLDSSDITKKKPERSQVSGLKKRSGGRNSYGRITVRHRGGGASKKYRMIDFKRVERDIPGRVVSIEYDPNRNVRIGLVIYKNGAKKYILMPNGLGVGSSVVASEKAEAKIGNCMPIKNIPLGFMVHNIEIKPNDGGTLARSAGASAQIMGKADDNYTTLKLPSGEIRMVLSDCWATIGVLGNADYKNISWGKAGRSRYRGRRPSVRGVAMNPVDHPHGGGEGRSKGSHPVSPQGKSCKGMRTRKRRKKNPLILRRRQKKK